MYETRVPLVPPTRRLAERHFSRLSRFFSTISLMAVVLVVAFPFLSGDESTAEAKEPKTKKAAKGKGKGGGKGVFENGCRVQSPQKFLERRSFVTKGIVDGGKHATAVRYLVEHYGNVGDDATRRMNAKGALSQAVTVQFFGMPVSVHSKVAPALSCVEKRIRKTCTGSSRYTPRALGGFRGANTYRGLEISNHLFGVALDIDPDRNPCCGCVEPWSSHPKCKQKSKSPFDRASMPRCWIKAFERYGFDWLGHDALEDTMHFEFLGDPDKIKR